LKKEIGKGAYEDLNKRIISLNELPRRKQRGIKDHNGENPSPQGAGYSPGRNKWIEETKFIQRVRGDLAFRSEEDVVENIHFTNLDSKL